jgi:hypothetical protein
MIKVNGKGERMEGRACGRWRFEVGGKKTTNNLQLTTYDSQHTKCYKHSEADRRKD